MKIHYLQHVSFEGPAYLEEWCKNYGHQSSVTKFYEENYTLPGLDYFDALVILGGPMSVYDENLYPWLKPEKDFISLCIGAGKKILGICLGAQLAALCLGAKVTRAAHKEIGWFPVNPTGISWTVPWVYNLFLKSPNVFHWHGEEFQLPEGSLNLLYSRANPNQAFLYKEQVLGLQFHLEVTPEGVLSMLDNCSHELTQEKFVQQRCDIIKGIAGCLKLNSMASALLKRFFLDVPNEIGKDE